ncbi:hypothetical protein BJ138DRAFT_1119775 [Hygrophoropsis aurantiaca]|uniref:Uncharacterized protein n=1 Tax=Hygrophoropsis aurantiaca TaxID=72124 RepID=A0ACB7ZTM9_9AGAM|nr:hypothetical protein BJ138DRAFT_1119775 [Hygrophoropsis aurantiaca]
MVDPETIALEDAGFTFEEAQRRIGPFTPTTKDDDELLYDKEKVVKKIKVETAGRIGLTPRTGSSGDPGSPAIPVEAAMRPRDRLAMMSSAVEREILHTKRNEIMATKMLQRPTFPTHRRHWKAVPSSRAPSSMLSDEQDSTDSDRHFRYLRLHLTMAVALILTNVMPSCRD